MAGVAPRVVMVTRRSDYEALIGRHATHGQAAFFLAQRGQDIQVLAETHARQRDAVRAVAGAIPAGWRRTSVLRHDLDRFVFEPEDIVVAVGQDGLVANVAKYLKGQTVVGINPMPERFDGVLVRYSPDVAGDLLHTAGSKTPPLEELAMAEAVMDDGQRLVALNEVFIGHRSHQSARYRLRFGGGEERQSSSGLIVTTGTGATGWARSIHVACKSAIELPAPTENALAFFVREAWPSLSTDNEVVEGRVVPGRDLEIVSEMNDGGVVFGDGIEADHLDFSWGRSVVLRLAAQHLRLLAA